MKKKLVLTVVIAIAFVGISIYLLQPRLIAKDIDLLDIDRVIHNVDHEERTDITEQIDLDLLKERIGRYKCSRIPHSFSPYQGQDVLYMIDGFYDNKPIHIILGEINVVYESSDKGGYKIKDSEKMLEEVISLAESNN